MNKALQVFKIYEDSKESCEHDTGPHGSHENKEAGQHSFVSKWRPLQVRSNFVVVMCVFFLKDGGLRKQNHLIRSGGDVFEMVWCVRGTTFRFPSNCDN